MKNRDRWRVEYTPAASRQLFALRNAIAKRIADEVEGLADDPEPGDSIAMRGKAIGLRRLRVGSYRVVYRIIARRVLILIVRVAHRSEAYRGWESF